MSRPIIILFFLVSSLDIWGQNQSPNILLIIADDMGTDITNGYLTSEQMPTTPVIDSLRDTGLKFANTTITSKY